MGSCTANWNEEQTRFGGKLDAVSRRVLYLVVAVVVVCFFFVFCFFTFVPSRKQEDYEVSASNFLLVAGRDWLHWSRPTNDHHAEA